MVIVGIDRRVAQLLWRSDAIEIGALFHRRSHLANSVAIAAIRSVS